MKIDSGENSNAEDWLLTYDAVKREDRKDSRRNPGILFQNLALEKSIVEALQRLNADKSSWKILDVGCGSGLGLLRLLGCGFESFRLYGIDIAADQVNN